MQNYNIFWFRRDMRLYDNAGLCHALKNGIDVKPIFIFDTQILDKLDDKHDARVEFIHDTLTKLKKQLGEMGSSLDVYYGNPVDIWKELSKDEKLKGVYANRDYETYAKERDQQVQAILEAQDKSLYTYKDHVIFEGDEVLKDDGDPYVVFTPYKRKWLAKLDSRPVQSDGGVSYYFKSYPNEKYFDNLLKFDAEKMITLEEMGFKSTSIEAPSKTIDKETIEEYDKLRNFPAIDGTSKLSVHFRFGTISIRDKARKPNHGTTRI